MDETVLKSVCIIMLSALLPGDSNLSTLKTVSNQAPSTASLKTKLKSRNTVLASVESKSQEVEIQVASVEVFVSGSPGTLAVYWSIVSR